MSRIVDGSTALAIEGGKTKDQLGRLIDSPRRCSNSQVQTSDAIATWAARTASITGQFEAQDHAAFGDLLETRVDRHWVRARRSSTGWPPRFRCCWPIWSASATSRLPIAADIEQLLVLYPQGTAVMSAIALADSGVQKQAYQGIYLDFNLNLEHAAALQYRAPARAASSARRPDTGRTPSRSRPVSCTAGFPQELVTAMSVGGRNIPCENDPAKRAPTVELCEERRAVRARFNDGQQLEGRPQRDARPGRAAVSGGGSGPLARRTRTTSLGAHVAGAFMPYDPADGDYIGPDGQELHPGGDLAHPGTNGGSRCVVPPADVGLESLIRVQLVTSWINARRHLHQGCDRTATTTPTQIYAVPARCGASGDSEHELEGYFFHLLLPPRPLGQRQPPRAFGAIRLMDDVGGPYVPGG